MMNITIEELNTIKQHWTNGWSRDSEVARAYRDDEKNTEDVLRRATEDIFVCTEQ